MTEEQIQTSCITWFNFHYPKYKDLLVHHHNNPRNPVNGARLKKLGLKAGIPDLVLYVPNSDYYCLFIEMKNEKGRLSAKQKEYKKLLQEQGYKWELCRSKEDFKKIISNYIFIY